MCSYNKLTSLPENLQDSIQKLYCIDNKITSLPEFMVVRFASGIDPEACDEARTTVPFSKLVDGL